MTAWVDRRPVLVGVLLAMVLILCGVHTSAGQKGAALDVRLVPERRASIRDVRACAVNQDTGVERELPVIDDRFGARDLMPGRYELRVSATAFEEVHTIVVLKAGKTRRLRI